MSTRYGAGRNAALLALGMTLAGAAPGGSGQTPRVVTKAGDYEPSRTSWGDPLIEGVYTNSDESLTPFERPDELAGRRLEDITGEELEALRIARSDARVEADRNRADLRSPLHWFENHLPQNSRAWLVIDPPDGKIPPPVPEAAARAAALAAARQGRGPADSYEDRGLYDRCISRGLPGSMMPAIYGNAYQIVQGPGYVGILYEMVHEVRVIPLDGAPHVGRAIRQYMGDGRGRWEGGTLVVETTNVREEAAYRGASADTLRIIERFTPVAPDKLDWAVTLEDSRTWTAPWTFAMTLSRRSDVEQPYEYACHEGNYGLTYMLTVARAEEDAEKSRAPAPRSRPVEVQAPPAVRLYVLDCGTLVDRDPSVYGLPAARVEMADPCFLVVHPRGTLLWDTGLGEVVGSRPARNRNDRLPRTLKGQLAEIGYAPADITYLALSHLHADHAGNANDYAGSTWIVQRAERDYMFSDALPADNNSNEYRALRDSRAIVIDGDHDVFADGSVAIVSTPGHTPGHQALLVRLPRTGAVLLSGDLYHFAGERARNTMPAADNQAQTAASRVKVERLIEATRAQLWIQHDVAAYGTLKKAPDYYD